MLNSQHQPSLSVTPPSSDPLWPAADGLNIRNNVYLSYHQHL